MITPFITFLTCSHRAPSTWLDTLASLAAEITSPVPFEVLVVNNGFPSEREAELARSAPALALGERLRFLREPASGVAHARTTGFRIARGEWIVTLDDDNTLSPGFCSALAAEVAAHPQLGGIIETISPVWERPIPDWLVEFGVLCLSYTDTRPVAPLPARQILSPQEVVRHPSPPGGGMIIHRDIMERYLAATDHKHIPILSRTQGSLFGCEDHDVWLHISKAKRPVLLTDRVQIFHHIPSHRTSFRYLRRLNYEMSYSFGYFYQLEGMASPPRSISGLILDGFKHAKLACTRGNWRREALWMTKSLGYRRGLLACRKLQSRPDNPHAA